MKIDSLYVKDFKNLKDFRIDFHVASNRQVVVGRNGVGKSNLLLFLIIIFRDLDLARETRYEYEIEYHCNDHYVRITNVLTKDGKFKRKYEIAKGDGEEPVEADDREYETINESKFVKRNASLRGVPNPDRLLPKYVFFYYSGTSPRFDEAFELHERKYYDEQRTGTESPLRPVFQAKPHHSQFALLSFFVSKGGEVDEKTRSFLKNEFRIEGLESVLFSFQEPYWWSGKKSRATKDKKADLRFWSAGGRVEPFLDSVFQHALAPMSGTDRKKTGVKSTTTIERRYCFIPDEEALQKVAGSMSPKEFFARLDSTVFSDLVDKDGDDVRIKVKLTDVDEPITFKDLSEGEQQLLTIIGLMRFTAENEGLFLLDEPDTHLNPAWCLDYLQNLREYEVEPENSQIILTTHSPLTFAGLEKNEVVILQRNDDGQVHSQHPSSSPRGMGFEAILTSRFFGMRAGLDRKTLRMLDEKRELAFKADKDDEDRKRIALLDEELEQLDFSSTVRDPLFLEFVRRMTEAKKDAGMEDPAPSSASWEKRKRLGKEIAKRLLQESEEKKK